ncbi:MAG: sulfotransferase [Anaerolineae bacterium]|nr:sulfotransferase [Anaerolineae bacterium]
MSQKVLYVAGAGRSGSTIFGNVLGQLEGFASFGELYNFPLRFLEQRYCGCGVRLPECPFWRQVVQLCWHGDVEAQLRAWLAQRDEVARARHALRWRLSFARQKLLLKSSAYRVTLAQFYRALAQVSGARVLVDTSKVAGYAQVLAWTPGIELYVVHLVREPRAVAYSWARTKLKPTPAGSVAIAPTSPVHGALKWLAHNLATELYCTLPRLRYMRTRYEDFVRDPCQTIRAVLDFVGERSPIPVAVDNSIALTAQHTVDGNPDRFSKGLVVLSADDEWRHRLDWRARTLVTLIAAPLLHRYGYA